MWAARGGPGFLDSEDLFGKPKGYMACNRIWVYEPNISSFLPGHSQEQSLPSRSSKDGPVNSAGTRNMDHWHLQASVLQQSKLINRLIAHRTQGDSCKCLWQQQNLLGRRSFGSPLSSWGAVCPGGRFREPACGVVAASGVNVT